MSTVLEVALICFMLATSITLLAVAYAIFKSSRGG
jgi:hypothetical protein